MLAFLRGMLKSVVAIGFILLLLPAVTLVWLLRWHSMRQKLVIVFFQVLSGVLNLRVRKQGDMRTGEAILLVSNHCSYLDVFVLGALLPVSFTPKSDVAHWPVVGFLCKLADCVFVERRPGKIKEARRQMRQRLSEGRAICLFPEGTTNDGAQLKPFKSGFLSLAEEPTAQGMPLLVQPATIRYTQLNGQDVTTQTQRDAIAWHGDMEFFPHLWGLLKQRSIVADVMFHAPVTIDAFESRKALTHHCETVIAEHLLHAKEVVHESGAHHATTV